LGADGLRLADAAGAGEHPAGPDRPYEIARVAEQVEATRKAVDSIFAYPTERIAQLTAPKQTVKQRLFGSPRVGR
jgi:hypothetical protein